MRIPLWKYAAISGILTDDAGEPFVGATVLSLRRSFAIGRSQFATASSASTDDRGFFRVASLIPGEHILCVVAAQSTSPAAVVDGYAEARLAGTQSDYQRQFSMTAIGFSASITSPGMRLGDSVLHPVGPYSRGIVPPAPDEQGRILSFQTTFYPNTIDIARAEVIALASGEERTGADIRLRLVPAVTVSGTVTGPAGPAANLGVRLAPEFSADLGTEQSFESAYAITDAAGRFQFLGVPAGNYTLRALKVPVTPLLPQPPGGAPPATPPPPPPLPPGPTLWANLPIAVGAEGIVNLTVKLGTGFRLSGRFHFDGKIPKPLPGVVQTLSVLVQPLDGHPIGFTSAARSRVDPDGSFATLQIPPGKYVIRMAAGDWPGLAGWTYRSSVVDGRDVGSMPLDLQGDVSGLVITMTDRPSEISGTVRDEKGRIDTTATVLVYSAERSDWSYFGTTPRRIRMLRPSVSGIYRIAGLLPGNYLVSAFPEAQEANWQDPRVMELMSKTAVKVTLGDGEKKTQDVVTKAIR